MKVCKLPQNSQEVAAQVADDIKHICKNIDKRFSGTQGEKDAADYLAAKLGEGTDDVRLERFKVHPGAFFGWINFTVSCILLAFVSYFFSTLVSILLLLVGVVPYLVEYVQFKRMYDPLFKQEESQNVYAVKHCTGDVKKRVVLVSHYDAGNEWHTKYVLGTAVFVAQRALNILGIAYLFAIDIARWAYVGGIGAGIASGAMLIAGLAGIGFVIPWAATYFFLSRKNILDSANDGLSGAVTAIYAFNSLKDVELEHTEVAVLLVGSGAVGMRGAMAFTDAHKAEFSDETVFVVANILREKKYLRVNTRELNGYAKSDPEAVKLVFDAAKETGLDCHKHSPVFSNTESGVFSAAGLRSVGVNAVSRQIPEYYHTRYDSFDNLSEECIAMGYELALEIIGRYGGEARFELSTNDAAPEAEQPDSELPTDDTPAAE